MEPTDLFARIYESDMRETDKAFAASILSALIFLWEDYTGMPTPDQFVTDVLMEHIRNPD